MLLGDVYTRGDVGVLFSRGYANLDEVGVSFRLSWKKDGFDSGHCEGGNVPSKVMIKVMIKVNPEKTPFLTHC
jgi:hypothetical protein